MISKYRFMETHLLQRKKSLESKIPDIKKTLEAVEYLVTKTDGPMEADFELADTLWAKARIPASCKKVNLWLGANVMLEYPIEEALELLKQKIGSASISLEQVDEDLEFIKEQITTMEVNTARVYNDEVKTRRNNEKK